MSPERLFLELVVPASEDGEKKLTQLGCHSLSRMAKLLSSLSKSSNKPTALQNASVPRRRPDRRGLREGPQNWLKQHDDAQQKDSYEASAALPMEPARSRAVYRLHIRLHMAYVEVHIVH